MLVRPYKEYLNYHAAGISTLKKGEIQYIWNSKLNSRSPIIVRRNELVFDYLLSFTDRNGTILASPKVIAAACHLSISRINTTLQNMSQAGLIQRKNGVIFLLNIKL